MMKYKVAIFDLDGTILDTLDDLKNSVNYALKKNSLPERSLSEIRSFVGNGIRILIEKSVPYETELKAVDSVFDDFKIHYKHHSADNTKPYDGIIETLKAIKHSGVKLAVVSNKADFAVQTLVDEYFPQLFDYSVGEKDGVRRKPYPDSVLMVLKQFNCQKGEAVYIGDSEVDVETAENVGIDCIAVTWGFRDSEILEKLNPKYIISKPNEIFRIIGE